MPLGGAIIYRDATVLDLSYDGWRAEHYTGGLDIHMAGGLVRLVFWKEVLHVTPSGDEAPGIGPVLISVEPREDNEEGDEQSLSAPTWTPPQVSQRRAHDCEAQRSRQ
jgi:hypothetical protein